MDNNKKSNKNTHPFHKIIGNRIQDNEFPDCTIIRSSDCGGGQKIPLFSSSKKDTKYCEVDLLIIKNHEIKVILEIEESGITPIKLYGKFFASAFSSNYIYKSKNYEMDDSVAFIQILKAPKSGQYNNIKKSIQNIIPIKGSKIDRYELFFGDISEFNNGKLNEISNLIHEVLK